MSDQESPTDATPPKKKRGYQADRKPQKPRKISPRQAKYIRAITKGLTKKEAALAAGYGKTTPGWQIERNIQNVDPTAIEKAMDRAGLTDDKILKAYVDALKARKMEPTGQNMPHREVKDQMIRVKSADSLMKLKGHFIERKDVSIKGDIHPMNLAIQQALDELDDSKE